MYYKIVSGGQIVDVSNGLNYVRWQSRNNIFFSCDEADANGIISSDGKTIFLLEGTEPIGELAFAHTAEITREQYEQLRQELIDNGVIDDPDAPQPDDGGDDGDTPDDQEPVAKSKLAQRVEALEAAMVDMTAKNDIPQGDYFVLHDEIYRATDPISRGSTIKPGYNCEKKSLNELVNMEGD